MNEQHNVSKNEKIYVSFEIEDLVKKFLIVIGSFIGSALLANWIKDVIRTNLFLTLLLGMIAFLSLFFAMRLAKVYSRSYVERYGWLVIPPTLAALFIASSLKPVVFVVLFILHAFACFFLRFLKNTARVGIELIMLITVLGSFVYGAKTGALLGATAMLMDYALSARFSYFVPVTTLSYAVVGMFAGNFSSVGITAVGIAATIAYNIVTSFIIVVFMGGHLEKCLRFGLSNIALNFALFTTVAPWLLSILT